MYPFLISEYIERVTKKQKLHDKIIGTYLAADTNQ